MDEMKNATSERDNQKLNGCLKGCLLFPLGIVILIAVGILAIEMIDHIPRTVDSQVNGEYIIELYSTSSPLGYFGPQDGRIVLKENNKTICSVDFMLNNDGKSMDYGNWKVDWKNDKVIVTIIGEEQKDEVYYLYYNGEISDINSDL